MIGFVVYKVANLLTELYQFEIDDPGLEKLELLTVRCTGAVKFSVSYTRGEILKKLRSERTVEVVNCSGEAENEIVSDNVEVTMDIDVPVEMEIVMDIDTDQESKDEFSPKEFKVASDPKHHHIEMEEFIFHFN